MENTDKLNQDQLELENFLANRKSAATSTVIKIFNETLHKFLSIYEILTYLFK